MRRMTFFTADGVTNAICLLDVIQVVVSSRSSKSVLTLCCKVRERLATKTAICDTSGEGHRARVGHKCDPIANEM